MAKPRHRIVISLAQDSDNDIVAYCRYKSKEMWGKENISGYISFLIQQEFNKENSSNGNF